MLMTALFYKPISAEKNRYKVNDGRTSHAGVAFARPTSSKRVTFTTKRQSSKKPCKTTDSLAGWEPEMPSKRREPRPSKLALLSAQLTLLSNTLLYIMAWRYAQH